MSIARLDQWCLTDFEKTDVFVRPAPRAGYEPRRGSRRKARCIEMPVMDTTEITALHRR